MKEGMPNRFRWPKPEENVLIWNDKVTDVTPLGEDHWIGWRCPKEGRLTQKTLLVGSSAKMTPDGKFWRIEGALKTEFVRISPEAEAPTCARCATFMDLFEDLLVPDGSQAMDLLSKDMVTCGRLPLPEYGSLKGAMTLLS